MSETKQTPLPWKVVAAGAGVRASVSQLYKLDTPLVGKTFGEELDEQGVNAALFQQSVNARPKVEVLIEAASACVDLAVVGADLGPRTTGAAKIADGDIARFKKALHEVEAALKGEA